MAKSDVLIIGGGVIGLITAITLAQTGARVTIVDAEINAGSTSNAGSLHVQMQSRFIRLFPELAPNVEAALPLYKQATESWAQLEQQLGPFDLVRKGGLMLAESAEQMVFLEQKSRREAAKGIDVALLDRSDLDKIAPWVGPQIIGAEICYNEGKLNPLLANTRLLARCKALGIERIKDRIERLEEAGHAVTAIGRKAVYSAREVVVSAAWGSGEVVSAFGINIPTVAEPLHMNITEACDQRIETLVQHAERPITLKQFATGQIVIGGGWPAKGLGTNTVPQVSASSMLGNVGLAARLVPAIGTLRIIRTWAGMNTTADGGSIIGRLPGSTRVIMAIPGDAGYTLGPLVAEAAASVVLGLDPPFDIRPFDPARFGAFGASSA
ncbi:MAG: glycine/D-amino acid oxidase-like deaminating enzyme [Sulfitobacter sp.]|jgi:glycine/D-amino acid oxidase-like deaminating enzyme